MRKVAGIMLVVTFASASAFGGSVTFENPSSPYAGDASALGLMPGESGTFDVFVDTADPATYNPAGSIDVVFYTDLDAASRGLEFGGWSFSTAFDDAVFQSATSDTIDQVSGANREFKVGGAALGNTIPLPMQIGTLTITAPMDLLEGPYSVDVDTSLEANKVSKIKVSGTTVIDPLLGSGAVHVVPEPATLALLGIGGVFALRRRRTA